MDNPPKRHSCPNILSFDWPSVGLDTEPSIASPICQTQAFLTGYYSLEEGISWVDWRFSSPVTGLFTRLASSFRQWQCQITHWFGGRTCDIIGTQQDQVSPASLAAKSLNIGIVPSINQCWPAVYQAFNWCALMLSSCYCPRWALHMIRQQSPVCHRRGGPSYIFHRTRLCHGRKADQILLHITINASILLLLLFICLWCLSTGLCSLTHYVCPWWHLGNES